MSLKALNSSGSWKNVPEPPFIKLRSSGSSYWDKCVQAYALSNSYTWEPIFDGARIIDDELAITYDFSVDRWLNLEMVLMDTYSGGTLLRAKGVRVNGSDGDGRTWIGNLRYHGPMLENIDFNKYVDSIRVRVVKTSNDGSDTVSVDTLLKNFTTVLNGQVVNRFSAHLLGFFDYYAASIYHDDYAGGAQNAGSMSIYLSAYPKGRNDWDEEGRKSYPCLLAVAPTTRFNETDAPINNFVTGDSRLTSTGRPTGLYNGTTQKANIRVREASAVTSRPVTTTITTTAGTQLIVGRHADQPLYVLADTFFGLQPYDVRNWNSGSTLNIMVSRNGITAMEQVASVVNSAGRNDLVTIHSESDCLALGQQSGTRMIVFCEYNKVELPLSWFTPPTSGGSGGAPDPGSSGCVAVDMFMDTQRQAKDINIGDVIDGSAYNPDSMVPRTVRANRVMSQPCLRMVTESGIAIVASESTPMTMRDGSMMMFPDMLGEEVLVNDEGIIRWERVVSLVSVGNRDVVVFNVNDQSYFAGEVGNRRIATHNAEEIKW